MGRRRGPLRPETLLVLILALLSAGIVSASVALALEHLDRRSVGGPVAALPDVLLSPAPARAAKVAPIGGEIQSELNSQLNGSNSTSEEVLVAVPSISPSDSPSVAPTPGAPPPTSPSPVGRVAMTVELQHELRGGSSNRQIQYSGIIKNTGDVALERLLFRSHVPSQTTWNDDVCGQNRLPVTLRFDGGGSTVICISGGPSIKGSDDPSFHPVAVELSFPIDPGRSIRIEWTVDVDSGAQGDVVNHAHAQANGLSVETTQAKTPL